MPEMVGQLLIWFYGISSELKFAVVSGIAAAIGAVIYGIAKATAWIVDRNPPKQGSDGIPTQAVGELLEDRDKRHSKEKSKLKKKMEKLKTASDEEKKTLEAEIAELRRREANPEQALVEAKETIAKLKSALEREGNTIGGDALEKATQSLESGDTSLAASLFKEIKARTALDVEASARASFALGEIAEQDIRWQEAFGHYREAARLHPSFDYLIHAQDAALKVANYPQAESLAKVARDVAEEEYGRDSPRYSTALNNLGRVLEVTGRNEEAESLYRQAIKVARVALGEDHSYYGISLNNLAGVLRVSDRFEEAELLYRQALENARVSLGEEHPQFGGTLSNLGGLLKTTGRLEEAEPLYRQALANTCAALGEDHPRFGTSLNNLAGVLEKMGRDEEAEPLYRQALEATRTSLGEEHPDFGIRLNNLALMLNAKERFDEADPLFRQAVGVFEKTLGSDHPTTQAVKTNLVRFLVNRPLVD